MAFDLDNYHATLEPPMVTVGGRTIRGTVLSFEQWLALKPAFDRIRAGEMSYDEWTSFVHRLCDLFFPPESGGVARVLKNVARWALRRARVPETVADYVLALPFPGQQDAIQDFCQSQARALGAAVGAAGTEVTVPTATPASETTASPDPHTAS